MVKKEDGICVKCGHTGLAHRESGLCQICGASCDND